MCLAVDYDYEWVLLDSGWRTARVEHICIECRRTIDPGERYYFLSGVYEGVAETIKRCAHCLGVIDLGVALTGCPANWWTEFIYDPDPEMGFVANILDESEHHLDANQRQRMRRCLEGAKAGWRRSDGRLRPIPAPRESDPHFNKVLA